MKIRIAVCDDELLERKLLEKQLRCFFRERETEAELCFYSSAAECMEVTEQGGEENYPELFLLDIYMAGQNGIELARRLRSIGAKGDIIFVTGGNEYASEAFEVGAFYYLQKPVYYEKLAALLERVFREISLRRHIDIVADRMSERIYLSEILWAETLSRKLTIYTEKRSYNTYMSLQELLSSLPETEFVQISRFSAAALSKITELNRSGLVLRDGTELSLGERYYPDVRKSYEDFRERQRGQG
ncbi:response regulator transcription factor [Oribacterium sp. oral taxon 102]|uniref:LytR/AlgR family response regulator transcription factor n=1 Tax=Oribacterium sp. oral taxon 102 TaxID=671214 RepID=UPI0015B9F02C|nr:LytTR family DNA-binding domain-containing protein [Oribacterium sp. oral taxon 102]NWO20451.1 response regulator transcription factor [Oribacterium sp. oral taxon 102]